MALYTNTTAYKNLFEEYKTLFRHLEENSGKKLKTLVDIFRLCDTLIVEKSKGYRYVIFLLQNAPFSIWFMNFFRLYIHTF